MRQMILALAACATLACPLASTASVLTFDDLNGANYFTQTYQGFNFGNNDPRTNTWFYSDAAASPYAPHSGAHFVSTDYSDYLGTGPLTPSPLIASATPFIFDGAWFSGADTIEYALFSGATEVYRSTASAQLTATPQYIASGYTGQITGVEILGTQGYYAMDDFTYHLPAASASVPEPGSLALALGGLLALGIGARRRKS